MKALIRRLVEAYGPSGREDEVRGLILSEVETRVASVETSPLGSLHAILNPGGGTKVMIAAHMDEIGVIVSHVDARGFARFQPVGCLNPKACLGHQVRFPSGILGVIGAERPPSVDRPLQLEKMFIDLGASSPDECPVRIGDIGVIDSPFLELGDRLVSKSMDGRIGVAILIEAIGRLGSTPHELQFAFTVQGEILSVGAHTSAFSLDPDLAIVVDITSTGDTPRGTKSPIKLGNGPAIILRDKEAISDPRLVQFMVASADAAKIPYQLDVAQRSATDTRAIQPARAGIPTAGLTIPCRYAHTPSEMIDLKDVEHAVGLLLAILSAPIEL